VPRVVACLMCSTLERMPDPPSDVPLIPARVTWMDGNVEREYVFPDPEDPLKNAMVPMYDPLMEDFVGRHGHDRPDTDSFQYIKVWITDDKTWQSMDVVQKIKTELADQQNAFMEEATGYKDDALKCYNAHKNPDINTGCRDFLHESKTIGRKDIPPKHRAYLCHMCPFMQASVATEARHKAGLYKKK